MNLEIIILSEVRKRQTNEITDMWTLKYDTNELTYKTEAESQRTDLSLPKRWVLRKRRLRVWN